MGVGFVHQNIYWIVKFYVVGEVFVSLKFQGMEYTDLEHLVHEIVGPGTVSTKHNMAATEILMTQLFLNKYVNNINGSIN